MQYTRLAQAYQRLEETSARLKLIEVLAELFGETPKPLLRKVVYLCQGKIAPDFAGVEIGLAEKLAARSVAELSLIHI